MQVTKIDHIALTGLDTAHQAGSGASSSFQRLLQEKITPMGKNAPDGEVLALDDTLTGRRVYLGTLSSENPTVSHLLYGSSHKDQCWDILACEVNADKPFTRIASGTPIFMDTRTSEIIWGASTSKVETVCKGGGGATAFQSTPYTISPEVVGKSGAKTGSEIMRSGKGSQAKPVTSPPISEEVTSSAPGLDQAVGAFIGTSYSRMNCYELVVEGLERMGVQYGGAHGLSRHLVEQASREGRSSYSLHSGEGLTRALGSHVFMESIPRISRVGSQARAVMNKMTDVLQEGQILSFSTPTRGHTGVISKKDGNWTFINSGVMDNNLAGKNGGMAVGEEGLGAEIKNWFTRAQKEGRGLTITLGAVDATKLTRFQQTATGGLSQRV